MDANEITSSADEDEESPPTSEIREQMREAIARIRADMSMFFASWLPEANSLPEKDGEVGSAE